MTGKPRQSARRARVSPPVGRVTFCDVSVEPVVSGLSGPGAGPSPKRLFNQQDITDHAPVPRRETLSARRCLDSDGLRGPRVPRRRLQRHGTGCRPGLPPFPRLGLAARRLGFAHTSTLSVTPRDPPRAGPFSRVFPGRPGTYLPRLAGGCEGPLRIGARRNLWMEIGKLNNLTLGKANASADAALTAARDRGIRVPRPEPAFTVNRFGCERVNASDRRENIKEVHDALEMGGGRHSWRGPGCHARFGTEHRPK